MSDTPETDRLAEEFKRNTLPDGVKLDILFRYTRKLERECTRLEHDLDKVRSALREAWFAMDEVEGTERIIEWQNKHANILDGVK